MNTLLSAAANELAQLLNDVSPYETPLAQLGRAMFDVWKQRGKVLVAGNGGSAADAMHFAEELVVRFNANRRALAAIALCDPTVLTCAGNDFGYESVFQRQVEALGNAGDLLIVMTTSGNSANLLRAIEQAQTQGMKTVAFLGKDGGALRGQCDIELLVQSHTTARIQEMHKLFFHVLCQWVDDSIDQL